MFDIHLAATFFTLGLVLLNLGLLTGNLRSAPLQNGLILLLLLGITGHLLEPFVSSVDWLHRVCRFFRAGIPCFFWLMCNAVFNDRFRLNKQVLAIVGVVIGLRPVMVVIAGMTGLELSGGLYWLVYWLPQSLEFVLIAHSLWVVLRELKDDLVNSRRLMRTALVGGVGLYIAVYVFVEQTASGTRFLEVLSFIVAAVLTLAYSMMLLRFDAELTRPSVLSDAAPEPMQDAGRQVMASPPAQSEPDNPHIDALRQLMTEHKRYRESGLTIGRLADELQLPEHKLRQMINREMGYKNFSDFLNGYRIEEACQRLSSQVESDTPILTIALEAGYASLSVFNRIFKSRTGMTPTQYREQSPSQNP